MPSLYYYITATDAQDVQVWQAIVQDGYDEVLDLGRTNGEVRYVIADLQRRGFTVTCRPFSTEAMDVALKNSPTVNAFQW